MNNSSEWWLLAPEIVLVAAAVFVLALDLISPARLRRVLPWVALPAPLLSLALVCLNPAKQFFHLANELNGSPRPPPFGGLLGSASDAGDSTFATYFFPIATFFVLWLGNRFLRRGALPFAEFNFLVLTATAAFMLLVRSQHFVLFFVALETAATVLCVLAAFNRRSGASLEAGLKYLLAGGLSGALTLFGIVLLSGAAGNPVLNGGAAGDPLSFKFLQGFIAANATQPFVLAGAALVTAGVVFKIGLVPFQHWVPDVYQGAPMPVTLFFATASKLAGVLALFALLMMPFEPLVCVSADGKPGPLFVLLAVLAGLTLLFAPVTALGQANTKRLMGLSGMTHAAFLTLALLAAVCAQGWDSFAGVLALFFYALAYIPATATVFGVMNEVALAGNAAAPPAADANADAGDDDDDTMQTTTDFQLLRERQPLLCASLCAGLGSLAGIPPSVGFFAKLCVLYAVVISGFNVGPGTPAAVILWVVAALGLLSVCGGAYYYFAWMRESFQRLWVPEERRRVFAANPLNPPLGVRLGLLALVALILLGGLIPALLQLLK